MSERPSTANSWRAASTIGVIAVCLLQVYGVVRLVQLQGSVDRLMLRVELQLAHKRVPSSAQGGGVYFSNCNGPSSEDLRAVVRDELRNAQAPAEPVPSAEEVTAPPSPENIEAFSQATRLVDGALAVRLWGDAQAEELRSLRARLTPDQAASLVGRLGTAINRQEIRVDAVPPF